MTEERVGEFEVSDSLVGVQGYIKMSYWEDEQSTVPAKHIVSAHERFYVRVKWEITSDIRHHLTGTWLLKIDAESVGTAGEYSSPVAEIPFDPTSDVPYVRWFALNPGVLQPAPGGTVFLIAATLSSLDAQRHSGHIWGFVRGHAVMCVPAD